VAISTEILPTALAFVNLVANIMIYLIHTNKIPKKVPLINIRTIFDMQEHQKIENSG
jgi:hypothetical protein